MDWKFWRRESGPRPVDGTLREVMMLRFKMPDAEVDRHMVMRRRGTFAGRPVVRIRVYDPSLLTGEPSGLRKYEHLDSQAHAVCYEGHIENGDSIDLNPRGCREEAAAA